MLRSGLCISPILSDDVVAALADVALGAPVNGMLEVAGSDKIHLDELVRRFLSASKDTRQVITGVHARFYGSELDDYSLIPGDNARIAPAHCFGSSPVLPLTALPNDLVAHPVRFFRSKKAHYLCTLDYDEICNSIPLADHQMDCLCLRGRAFASSHIYQSCFEISE